MHLLWGASTSLAWLLEPPLRYRALGRGSQAFRRVAAGLGGTGLSLAPPASRSHQCTEEKETFPKHPLSGCVPTRDVKASNHVPKPFSALLWKPEITATA
uniref:Uncharacterized protein n=1 Tax=Accipiter nisus TaxID=211598 RepID=A0A8B9M5F2_9AVES